jgi:hypothetical protein
MEAEDINAHLTRADAQLQLAQLRGRPALLTWSKAPPPPKDPKDA